jgi:hypothetical protein
MKSAWRLTNVEWGDNGKGQVLMAFQRKSIRSRSAAFVLSGLTGTLSFEQGITLVVDIPTALVESVHAAENILIVLFENGSIADEFVARVEQPPQSKEI